MFDLKSRNSLLYWGYFLNWSGVIIIILAIIVHIRSTNPLDWNRLGVGAAILTVGVIAIATKRSIERLEARIEQLSEKK
jgi:hypothetical protein